MRNPILASDRLYLRPVEPEDGTLFAEIEAYEDETIIHMGGRDANSTIASLAMTGRYAEKLPPDSVEFAVCLKENDECIGFVGVVGIDWIHEHGETYSNFRPGPYRGKGYGTEAKFLLLEYAFDHIGLHVLTSWVWELNTRSAAAVRKQGYKLAGALKFDGIEKGVYYDDLVFDILREDWLEARDAWRAAQQARG